MHVLGASSLLISCCWFVCLRQSLVFFFGWCGCSVALCWCVGTPTQHTPRSLVSLVHAPAAIKTPRRMGTSVFCFLSLSLSLSRIPALCCVLLDSCSLPPILFLFLVVPQFVFFFFFPTLSLLPLMVAVAVHLEPNPTPWFLSLLYSQAPPSSSRVTRMNAWKTK